MMEMPPWENPATKGASGKYGFRNLETDVGRTNEKAYRTVTTDPSPPRRRGVHHPKMLLHAVRTSRRLGNQMSCSRLGSLDLDKAFRAYRLVATPRVVDIRGIILNRPRM